MLQTSTCLPYLLHIIISGAMYPGVPQAVVAKVDWGTHLAKPKSDILISDSSSADSYNKFSGLRSR
jgi:hypothetical protein